MVEVSNMSTTMSDHDKHTESYPWRRIADGGPVVNHTPGPWFMQHDSNPGGEPRWKIGRAFQGEDMRPVVIHAAAYVVECCGPEQRCNAKLVAAAPELFQTCAALFDQLKHRLPDDERAKIYELLTRAYS